MDDNNCKLTQEQIDELVQRGKAQNGVLTYGDVMGTINRILVARMMWSIYTRLLPARV